MQIAPLEKTDLTIKLSTIRDLQKCKGCQHQIHKWLCCEYKNRVLISVSAAWLNAWWIASQGGESYQSEAGQWDRWEVNGPSFRNIYKSGFKHSDSTQDMNPPVRDKHRGNQEDRSQCVGSNKRITPGPSGCNDEKWNYGLRRQNYQIATSSPSFLVWRRGSCICKVSHYHFTYCVFRLKLREIVWIL